VAAAEAELAPGQVPDFGAEIAPGGTSARQDCGPRQHAVVK